MNSSVEHSTQYIGSGAWITVFAVIFILIISGNLLTILAITSNKHLWSITANKFIFSLALSDLLVGMYIPYHVCFFLYFDEIGREELFCVMLFMVPVFACSHSICKLLTIAADRYIAIVYPLHYNRIMTNKMVWSLILGGWILTIAWSTVPIYYNGWDKDRDCDMVKFLRPLYFDYMLTPLFGAAWVSMFMVYVKIWREANKHAKRIKISSRVSKKIHINDSKSLQVVMLTLGCFSVCWMPYFIVTTYFRITGTSIKFSLSYEIAFTLAVCNSGMNPVIYAWKNSNFREAFWCLLTCHSPNDATKKTNYITNHIPSSKKSSIANSAEKGHDNIVAQINADVEMDSQAQKDYDEHECSVSTEMTIVTQSWT